MPAARRVAFPTRGRVCQETSPPASRHLKRLLSFVALALATSDSHLLPLGHAVLSGHADNLDVYQLGLEFLVLAERVIQRLPKGRSHLADQLTRSSISIALNIAEGAGKFSKGDKRRYYLAARGSAAESAALLDIHFRLKLAGEGDHRAGKQMLERIVAMLVKLARSFERA